MTENRKFKLVLLCVLLTTLALFTDKIDGSVFQTLLIFLVGLYGAANVAHAAVTKSPGDAS